MNLGGISLAPVCLRASMRRLWDWKIALRVISAEEWVWRILGLALGKG